MRSLLIFIAALLISSPVMAQTTTTTTTASTTTTVQNAGCSSSNFAGMTCYPADHVAIDLPTTKDLQTAYEDGDLGGTGDIESVWNCLSGACTSMTPADGDKLDFSNVSVNTTTEGLFLPYHSNGCTTASTSDGQVCWQRNTDKLYIGLGAGGYKRVMMGPNTSAGGTNGEYAMFNANGDLDGTALPVITYTHCNAFYAPVDEVQDDDDVQSVFRAPQALTITEIWCKTEGTGTPIVGFELINGGDQVNGDGVADYIDCPEAGISDSTLAGVTAMADGDVLDWDIESGGVSGTTVTGLTVCVEYTFD